MTRIRSPSPIAAGLAVVGFLAGGAILVAQSPPYRATTTLVVEVHGVPAAPTANDVVPTVAALVVSDVVVENVAAAGHLDFFAVRAHLHGSVVPGTALIRIGYDDASAVRAQQLAQEVSSALQAVVAARFGSRLTVAVVDPLRSARRGRAWLRDALLAVLAGTVLGFASEMALAYRPRRRAARPRPRVTARAAPAAARRKPKSTPEPAPVAKAEPVPKAEPVLKAEPVPKPVPKPVPEPVPVPDPAGRVVELRRLLAARRDEFDADQVVMWEAYLEALEAQTVDGKLPPALESLALGVFEPLLERAG
jgi:hypothetical protein